MIFSLLIFGQIIVNPPQPSRISVMLARTMLGVQMISCGTDYGTTMYAMGTGNFEERNPVWAWAEHKPVAMGIGKLGSCATVSAFLFKSHKIHPWRTIIISSILTSLSIWATINNMRIVRNLRIN